MSDAITIRTASKQDLPALLTIEQAIITYERPFEENMQSAPFHYYDLEELLQLDNARVVVAQHQGKIIGSGYAHIKKSRHYLNDSHHAYLGFMYVDPAFRGQQINQKIIDALTAWAKERKIDVLSLKVFAENKSAIKAYQKAGFHQNLIEMRRNVTE